MTLEEALELLQRHGQPKVRELNIKNGAPDNHFGVKKAEFSRFCCAGCNRKVGHGGPCSSCLRSLLSLLCWSGTFLRCGKQM